MYTSMAMMATRSPTLGITVMPEWFQCEGIEPVLDRLQAAFWYYVFQIRSRPWAEADRQRTRGSGAAALRASISETLGRPINEWLGSDPAAWKETGMAAIEAVAQP